MRGRSSIFGWLILVGLVTTTCRSPSAELATPALPIRVLPNSVTFFALADWGVGGLFHQQAVADQLNQYAGSLSPSFLVLAGDNFYTNGVQSVNDPKWQLSFEQVYSGSRLPQAFEIALGNHDYQGNVQAQLDYALKHPRWQLPARYYTKVFVSNGVTVRLLILDTSPFINAYRQTPTAYPDILQNTDRQLQWADSVLTHSTEMCTIVVGHHPIYSAGADHGDQPELINQLLPLLQKHKVPLYLSGHSHTLQHLSNGGVTDFVISGGGGAPLGSIADSSRCAFSRASGGFAVISANTDSLQVSFVNQGGHLLYQFRKSLPH
ncbi:metallophosphoesterase [Fibrella sp. HMF5335]|uniref:acid phosphatase n=1 Tax=Fibrella rubiginis TaxID=2817060 RepID=A0A939GK32_9BACT|nr:metallophosphoesterase [Fibrella rubiginis]MBO0939283.1 metallophosphoesterase [Fibrella rubiginis]